MIGIDPVGLYSCYSCRAMEGKKGGNALFNDALNTFYLTVM